jgi:flagellar hook-length control protein FliK
MANIAPLLPFSPPAQQPGTSAATGTGSENLFSSILNDTVSNRESTSLLPSQKKATSPPTTTSIVKNRSNQDEAGQLNGTTTTQEPTPQSTATIAQGVQQDALSLRSGFTTQQSAELNPLNDASIQSVTISTETNTKLQQLNGQQLGKVIADNRSAQIIPGPWSSTSQTAHQPIISAQLQQLIEANEKGIITITRQPAVQASLDDLNLLKPTAQPSLTLTPETGGKIFEMSSLSQSTDIRSKIFDALLNQNGNTAREYPQSSPDGSGNKAQVQPQLSQAALTTTSNPDQASLSQSTDIRNKIFDALLNQNGNTAREYQQSSPDGYGSKAQVQPQLSQASLTTTSNPDQAAVPMQTSDNNGKSLFAVTPQSMSIAGNSGIADFSRVAANEVSVEPGMRQHVLTAPMQPEDTLGKTLTGYIERDLSGGDRTATLTSPARITPGSPDVIQTSQNSRNNISTASVELNQLRATNSPTAQSLTQPGADLSPMTGMVNQPASYRETIGQTSTEKPTPTDLEPLRQDARSRFLEASIEARNKDSNNQNQQSGKQEQAATFQSQPASQTTITATPEPSASFSQVSQGVLSQSTPQPSTTVAQPVIIPSSPQMYEESVMNQVAERFQFHTRNQETQLNIKLHPVELGELKIELNMKDGNIRAHVIAQTGQVQQILEKNMPRLKEMLQSQGMQLEEILVSTQAENVGEFDLPGDQLSKRDTSHQQNRQNIDTTFKDTFESIVTDETPVTGVNVKA